MNLNRYKTFFVLCLILSVSSPLHARVHEYVLENGLKVLVKPDHRFPVVISQIWYKVGSSYEYGGITGISHMLEHMMFKGTPDVPSGEFSRTIAALGGQENAFTSSDYTAYFQRLEKSRLETSFRLEADRMRNALFPEDEFIKERDVVAEERRLRTEDNPQAKAFEQFKAAAFVSSPYHHSVIGWMADIQSYDVEDARQW
ncbi:MAG TPA: pitrilysin family protein, partial [Gammaproteobacteria bacterium]